LLAGHEQSKLERTLQKEAKLEAKRQAEQAKRDAEIQKREVLIIPVNILKSFICESYMCALVSDFIELM